VQADAAAAPTAAPGHGVSFGEAVRVWARIALLSFGGPAGQIALMHRILVDEKKWIGEQRFLHALNYCMLLPGPEAQQLAVYIGWLLHKTRGGLVAGTLFVLPGFLAILALSYLYVLVGSLPLIEGLFFGLKCAVLAIVAQAAVRIGSRALRSGWTRGIAAASFVAIFVLSIPFPAILLAAAAAGIVISPLAGSGGGASAHGASGSAGADRDSALGERLPAHARPGLAWSLRIVTILLLLWLVPTAALFGMLGAENVFSRIGLFFSQMAVVTFGGAYAVLGYVAQAGVERFAWLSPTEMLDGLALAETTPGPLIMVVQFVGFLAAFRNAGGLDPLVAATLGAVLTTWVTFVPCFLWIFLGAPFAERLRANRALAAALAAITAAVVGVILNLALWFALHTLFARVTGVPFAAGAIELPVLSTLQTGAMLLTMLSGFVLFRLKWGILPVLGISAGAGMALHLPGLA
jgi:chromate transporter